MSKISGKIPLGIFVEDAVFINACENVKIDDVEKTVSFTISSERLRNFNYQENFDCLIDSKKRSIIHLLKERVEVSLKSFRKSLYKKVLGDDNKDKKTDS